MDLVLFRVCVRGRRGASEAVRGVLHFVLVPSVFTLSIAPSTKTENQSRPQHLLHYVLNCDKGPWPTCTLSPGRSFDLLSSASQSTRSRFHCAHYRQRVGADEHESISRGPEAPVYKHCSLRHPCEQVGGWGLFLTHRPESLLSG